MNIYVSNNGNDGYCGNEVMPLKTIRRAQEIVRSNRNTMEEDIVINIEEGTYYLENPIIFQWKDSGTSKCDIIYRGIGKVIFSGGILLNTSWEIYKDNIYRTKVEKGVKFDQLFVNGKRKIMARYPNFDEKARYFNGYAKDSFDNERVSKYKNPKGGFMHAMHEGLWGDFHYKIVGKNSNGELIYEGGHQNNRPSKMNERIRYIENIFEELTCPSEWYLDEENWMLYYMVEPNENIYDMKFEGAILKNIISFIGEEEKKVSNITIENICFTHAARAFMEPMEQILRSDWCAYRGGAVYLENTENISILNCEFDQLGGNGITISRYNKNDIVKGCYIHDAGASSVLVLGDLKAVRSPLLRYEEIYDIDEKVDWGIGPKSEDYPRKCEITDNLMVRNGRCEKQSAGVCISMSQDINVSHNTIYDVPRAGINICDGTWGGHEIEYNMVFHTVLETSDHGAFNSWGRDRYWDYRYDIMQKNLEENCELPLLDAVKPVMIHDNCFQCDNGWDIDLDDGASNYHIFNNICLKGGIKNREGVFRKVYNNIILNNTYHPHVWFKQSNDEFYRNIIFKNYADIGLNGWGKTFDNNILYKEGPSTFAKELHEKSGMDKNSITFEIEFENLSMGNLTLKDGKELEKMNFNNIDISKCGVISKKLKNLAHSPFEELYTIEKIKGGYDTLYDVDGMKIKKLSGLGEVSATGMYQESGIYIKNINTDSIWYKKGLRQNDVIISIDEKEVNDVKELLKFIKEGYNEILIWREQMKISIN